MKSRPQEDGRGVRDSLRVQKKGPPTRGKATNKNHNKVMEKKVILKKDLGEILTTLAESAVDHTEKTMLDISVYQFCESKELSITVRRRDDFSTIKKKEYVIIDNVEDDMAILDDTVMAALADMEKDSNNVTE